MKEMTFSAAQTAAIYSRAKRLLIVAGPGSGKTEVMARRIVRMIEEGEDASKMVAVTFTNKAGKALADRIESIRPGIKLGYIGTIHGLCLRLLENYGAHIGYQRGLSVLDDEQSEEGLKEAAALIGRPVPTSRLIATRDKLGTRAGEMKPMTPEALVVATYYRRLQKHNATDYQGLLTEAARLVATTGPMRLFRHLCVEEFQDTSDEDMNVITKIIHPDGTWTVVGDPDQAIYNFRGGNVAHILRAAQGDKNFETLRLELNFRSDRAICEAAQRLISHCSQRVSKETTPAGSGYGFVEFLPVADNEFAEAAAIFTQIAFMIAKNEVRPEQVAVLARTNAVVKTLRDCARSYNIPVESVETLDMVEGWPFAKACVALLASPRNDLAALNYIRMVESPAAAKVWRERAALEKKSVAELYFAGSPPTISTFVEMAQALANLGVTKAGIHRIMTICEAMPPEATVADAAMALRWANEDERQGVGMAITTMHAAKGREWPVVFLAAMENEVIPGKKAANLDEERRVAYVAVTRAMHGLFISHARARRAPFGNGQSAHITSPSIFTLEMQKGKS